MDFEGFRLVDTVDSYRPGSGRIRMRAVVPERSSILDAHFPGHPLVPGVLLIETMAQASGYLLLASGGCERMPFLAEVNAAKLRRFVGPGSVLLVEANLVHEGSGYAVTEARIEVEPAPGAAPAKGAVAEAELRFRTVPFPSPDLRGRVAAAMRAVGLADAPS